MSSQESFGDSASVDLDADSVTISPEVNGPGFDPLSDLLVAQVEKPSHLKDINLRTLTPYQRALLTIDGTVTKFIEAYVMEPIMVRMLEQDMREIQARHPWLEVDAGTPVITRQVILEGKYSKRLFAYAVSLLVHDQLPENVREDLKVHPQGIGRVLIKNKLETRREVLWYGREEMKELPDAVRSRSDGRFNSRTYRVICSGKPFMLINEKFPMTDGQILTHH
ncbi:MAG: chorismate pyruvate-lyase family protein [Rhodothermales bacterium]